MALQNPSPVVFAGDKMHRREGIELMQSAEQDIKGMQTLFFTESHFMLGSIGCLHCLG